LQTKIASINKPLIAVAPGHAMNSGASLLASTAHPMATLTSKICFNEVTFGFVPHSGSTFHMSRMPGEFGTFMALTGLNINGSDAVRVDIARGVVSDPIYFS
jgi:enoyl-CoA hydratase